MSDGRLVFTRPDDGTGRLIFGDDGGGSSTPATDVGIDAAFADDMQAAVQLLWDANVSRVLTTFNRSHWQDAAPAIASSASHWQDSQPIASRAAGHWQDAALATGRASARWQDSRRLSARSADVWQYADALRHLAVARWQDELRLRSLASTRWQDAGEQRALLLSRWQEQLRRRGLASTWWQEALPMSQRVSHSSSAARAVHRTLGTHWQDARKPLPGRSRFLPPDPPAPEPCYDPETLGTLVFTDPWVAGDGRLVFTCVRGGGYPPGTIVVPVRKAYVVHNSVTLYRLPSGTDFRASSFTLDIDADSWTFSWSASLHSSARAHLQRTSIDERVEVLCVVNGVELRLVIESMGRDRSFPEDRLRVQGLGRAAFLDDNVGSFGNATERTAQQLMGDVLTVNGVSLGWSLDWQLTDWVVPGNLWTFQGSHIEALKDIAGAVGGYIQPHLTDQVLRVLHRYPVAPWDWESDLTPDIVLPVAATSVENIEEVILPRFNQVHVGGIKAPSVFGPVTRGGTPGDKEAEQALHALITAAPAHLQRGRAVLSNTGLQEHLTLRTLLLPETGLVMPGTVVSYVSDDRTRLGIVRKMGLQMSEWPAMHQTLGVESHVFE